MSSIFKQLLEASCTKESPALTKSMAVTLTINNQLIINTFSTPPLNSLQFHHQHHHPTRHQLSPTGTFPPHSDSAFRRGSVQLEELQRRRRICLHEATCFKSNQQLADLSLSFVDDFDPTVPIQNAFTPPSSWYTDPSFLSLELSNVFYRSWQAVGN